VFVLSIPHWERTPFARDRDTHAIGRELDAFNAMVRLLAAARGVAFVDTTEASRDVATDASLTAADGLHPSGALYARWATLALPVVLERLGAR
jgi:lysophospholipase L1-like esterase